MSMESLLKVLNPPVDPREVPSARHWEQVKAAFGSVPQDYHDFTSRFGSGKIDDFLYIFSPSTSNKHLNLSIQAPIERQVITEAQKTMAPTPPYPDPRDLIPFGRTDNGDTLFWVARGKPEDWKIMIREARGPKWEQFDSNLTSFLADLLSRRLSCRIFPDDFPSESPVFA